MYWFVSIVLFYALFCVDCVVLCIVCVDCVVICIVCS